MTVEELEALGHTDRQAARALERLRGQGCGSLIDGARERLLRTPAEAL
jgi:hypothetical protein